MGDLIKPNDNDQTITERMELQHPLHAHFAQAYENLGGLQYLEDFAEENPGQFLTMFLRLAPLPQQKGGGSTSGNVQVHIHPALAAGPLDVEGSVVIDQE